MHNTTPHTAAWCIQSLKRKNPTMTMAAAAFEAVLPALALPSKPRERGLTEIRDKAMSLGQTRDLVELFGAYIDSVKWSSGSQRLVSRDFVKEKNQYLNDNGIDVSTGGLIERVVLGGLDKVDPFLDECIALNFNIVEVSSGSAIMSLRTKTEIVKQVVRRGLKAKPEVAMAYSPTGHNPIVPAANADALIYESMKLMEAGAWKIILEEDGIFRYVSDQAYDVVFKFVRALDLDNVVFEASEPSTFNWIIKTFGTEANIFVDPSHITNLASLRMNVWGYEDTWGRVAS